MKKKFFQVLLVMIMVVTLSACGTKKKDIHKTGKAEDLMDQFVKGYETGDVNLIKDTLPEFQYNELDQAIPSKDEFKKQFVERFGDDYKVTYEIKNKRKENDEWIENNNKTIKEQYKSDDKLEECYALEGTITFKGSKNSDTDDLEEVWYCKINNKWFLVMG